MNRHAARLATGAFARHLSDFFTLRPFLQIAQEARQPLVSCRRNVRCRVPRARRICASQRPGRYRDSTGLTSDPDGIKNASPSVRRNGTYKVSLNGRYLSTFLSTAQPSGRRLHSSKRFRATRRSLAWLRTREPGRAGCGRRRHSCRRLPDTQVVETIRSLSPRPGTTTNPPERPQYSSCESDRRARRTVGGPSRGKSTWRGNRSCSVSVRRSWRLAGRFCRRCW